MEPSEGIEETAAVMSDQGLMEKIHAGEEAIDVGDTVLLDELQDNLKRRKSASRSQPESPPPR